MSSVAFDLEAAAAGWRRREAEHTAARQRDLAEARDQADAIVTMIVGKYQPRRVWQWGSLLHGRGFSEVSDIDIAVEGILEPERFFALLGDAEAMTRRPLDVVQLELIDPVHAESIRRKGRLVYDATQS